MTKLEQLILRFYDQFQSILSNRGRPSTVAFFVNPPEGAGHGQNVVKSKIGQHFYFKNFWKVATFMLGQKKFSSQN